MLNQGLRAPTCPLCHVAHKLDREYIWPGDPLPAREQCPACRYREEELARNARNLHGLVEENPQARERFTGGPGLCVAHFRLAWEQASQTEERRRLLDVQRAATSGAVEALRAHIDRQTDRAAGDPAGTDADAWRLAIRMTAGWP
jgi:hypothetical protein